MSRLEKWKRQSKIAKPSPSIQDVAIANLISGKLTEDKK